MHFSTSFLLALSVTAAQCLAQNHSLAFTIPLQAGNATLPPPYSNETLKFLALGRGTQNYSCASPQSIPVAIGALAALFDASSLLASTPPDLLFTLPAYALTLATPFIPLTTAGHHFFDSTGTPNFDLSAEGLYLKGMTVATIAAPPTTAIYGLPIPETKSVPWLNLVAKYGGVGSVGLSSVYRVQVAGGEPPASCANIAGTTIQVQYSALYAFLGPSNSSLPSTVLPVTTPTQTTLAAVSTPTSTPAATSICPASGGSCSTNGQLACNGGGYGQCVDGNWVIQQCGTGLVCVPNLAGLYCDVPGTGPDTTCTA